MNQTLVVPTSKYYKHHSPSKDLIDETPENEKKSHFTNNPHALRNFYRDKKH